MSFYSDEGIMSRKPLFLHPSRRGTDFDPDRLVYHVVSLERVFSTEEILDQQMRYQLLPATRTELQCFWSRLPDLRVNKLTALGTFCLVPGVQSFHWVSLYPSYLGGELSWRGGRLWDRSYSFLFVYASEEMKNAKPSGV